MQNWWCDVLEKLAIFSQEDLVKVSYSQLSDIKEFAKTNKCNRSRLCLHDSPENKLQDMFICRTKDDVELPHKHEHPESHIIIEGAEIIVLFDYTGKITDAFLLEKDKGYLAYRVDKALYHATIVLTDLAVDYEVKLGPYRKDEVFYADWKVDKVCMDKIIRDIMIDSGYSVPMNM